MSGKEMCLCDWYTKCPNCLKPRTGYARLADDCAYLEAENKRLQEALDVWMERYEDAEEYVRMLASAMESWLHPDGSQPEVEE